MKKILKISSGMILGILIISACSSQVIDESSASDTGMMGSGGMMGNGGRMRFHMATIPDEYAGLESLIPSDGDSIERGQIVFTTHCASCHGDGGMGDGPAGVALDPSPAPIAHTSQMMGDNYLFWRISEGGAAFETAMISFKDILSEQERWDVINYIRALGSNQVEPQRQFGGTINDPELQATQQAEMLSAAVEQGVISQEEADFFADIHPTIDEFMENNRDSLDNTERPMMESGLETMVAQGIITEEEADRFVDIHDRLLVAGLME